MFSLLCSSSHFSHLTFGEVISKIFFYFFVSVDYSDFKNALSCYLVAKSNHDCPTNVALWMEYLRTYMFCFSKIKRQIKVVILSFYPLACRFFKERFSET